MYTQSLDFFKQNMIDAEQIPTDYPSYSVFFLLDNQILRELFNPGAEVTYDWNEIAQEQN